MPAETIDEQILPEKHPRPGRRGRTLRGLVPVFFLSFVSLVGVMLTIAAFGGFDGWTSWQFIGLFGLIEAGSGVANIISPNIWRLPVAEVRTRHTAVKLAPSALAIPHWGGAARAAAGLVLMLAAARDTGVDAGTLAVVPLVALIGVILVFASALLARAGVARPDIDVIQFVIRRPGREYELQPISIGASILQFFLSIVTLPFVKVFPSSVLYQPELAPSAEMLAGAALLALALAAASFLAWSGRIDWQAPREQQREAEKFA